MPGYSKEQQLARGERRRFRKVANWRERVKLRREKLGPCRTCGATWDLELHHLVKRSAGGGDVADNLVSLCRNCHHLYIHKRDPIMAHVLLANLSDAEYAYMIERGGEDYPERAYGVSYER